MSDTTDDLDAQGRRLLEKSQVDPLKERMEAFLADHQSGDLKTLRAETSDGVDLSALVDEEREERL